MTKFAAVKFKWQKDDKTFDYIVPEGLALAVGDVVVVATKRGETTVTIVELKDESELATVAILRKAEPKPDPIKTTMDF